MRYVDVSKRLGVSPSLARTGLPTRTAAHEAPEKLVVRVAVFPSNREAHHQADTVTVHVERAQGVGFSPRQLRQGDRRVAKLPRPDRPHHRLVSSHF